MAFCDAAEAVTHDAKARVVPSNYKIEFSAAPQCALM